MITCKRCKNDKPDSEMLQRRGKPSKVCMDCFRLAHSKGVDAADKEAKKFKKGKRGGKAAKRADPAADTKLTVSPTYGFETNVDEYGSLHILQRNADGPDDEVILSKAEFGQIFEKYRHVFGL